MKKFNKPISKGKNTSYLIKKKKRIEAKCDDKNINKLKKNKEKNKEG